MPHIKTPRDLVKPLVSLLASAALVLSLAPASAWANVPSAPSEPTQEQLAQLLSGQEYAEGEVIVVAEASADLGSDTCELLATADKDALQLTAAAKLASDDPTQAVSTRRAQASQADAYEVLVIHSDAKSTQQLMDELYDNPQVLSVEPNTVTSAFAPSEQDADANGIYAQSEADYPTVGNLTPQQWYFNNDGTYSTLEGAAQPGVDMAVPGQGTEPDTINSSGVIAIVDSGLDVNHPDLKDVLFTFTNDQQARFGCGEHGFNAATDDPAKLGDLTDSDGHGTHVAGIAAASWNSEGVSGVANGAKLVGVRVTDDEGSQTLEAGVRAFSFLIRCAKEINLKAVNCSWSSPNAEFTYTLLANQLGAQGAVTVFAAGNERTDIGQALDTSSFTNSPYLISVGAHNSAGGAAGFSNYGPTSVDVFAPGVQMLSTVPAKAGGDLKRFLLPTSADEDGIVALHTFADGRDEGVAIYATNPLADGTTPAEAEPLESVVVTQDAGVDDTYSLAIPVEAITATDGDRAIDGEHFYGSSFFAAVPVASDGTTDPIRYVSARCSAALAELDAQRSLDQMKVAVLGAAIQDAQGEATHIADMRDDQSGSYASADTRAGIFSWLCSTLEVSRLLQEGEQLYLDDQGRMLVEFGIEPDSQYATLYLDNIAVGTASAQAGAYELKNGSSMAAPAAAGAVAVVAKDEPTNASASDPGELALQRAARLRAATVWSDELDGVCATGGYLHLGDLDASKMAPIITSTATSGGGRYLRAEGHFIGAEGSVAIDGADVQTTTRDDKALVVQLPQDLPNGAHVLTVSTASGQDKFAFTTSGAQDQLKQYERELAVPDFISTLDLAGDLGVAATGGGLVASGDRIYTLGFRPDQNALCLWQYTISDDTWNNCGALPVSNYEPYGTVLATSEDGVILYVCIDKDLVDAQADDGDATGTITSLYSYHAGDGSWTNMEVGCKLPELSSIFTKGDDLYFVGGRYNDEPTYLCAYHTKSQQVEVMEDLPKELAEERGLLSPSSIAVGGDYIYVGGIKSGGLLRLHLNEAGKVDKVDNLTESLVGKVTATNRVKDTNRPAVAATPSNGFVVGTELDATDTYTLAPTADTLEPLDYTSSFYHSNMNAAVWHDDVLYAIGYSPSEQSRVFFRAHSWPVEHNDPQPEPANPSNTSNTPDTPSAPQHTEEQSGATQAVRASSAQTTQATSRTATPSTADTLPSWTLLALVGCALLGVAISRLKLADWG